MIYSVPLDLVLNVTKDELMNGKSYPEEGANTLMPSDDKRYILRAAALEQPKQEVEWDGEGLPSIGIECEMKYKHSSNAHWRKCKVFAYDGGAAAIWHLDNGWNHATIEISQYEFRKIKSERELVIEQISKIMYSVQDGDGMINDLTIGAVVDAFNLKPIQEGRLWLTQSS